MGQDFLDFHLAFSNFAEQQNCWVWGLWSEICVLGPGKVLQERRVHQSYVWHM